MIALSRFVVEPQRAFPVNDEGEPILEGVLTPGKSARQLPDHQFGKTIYG
jgi:hypothetical protein